MTKEQDDDIETNRDDLAIAAFFVMISASRDSELSAGIKHGGGVFTSAILQTFQESSTRPSWLEVMERVRLIIKEKGFSNQVPQISASIPININDPFTIVPNPQEEKINGRRRRKRAVIIGINYVDQPDISLTGSWNDSLAVQKYLIENYGFDERDMAMFLDDSKHFTPSRDNILKAFTLMAMQSDPGDVVFVHYAGHGRQYKDTDGTYFLFPPIPSSFSFLY